MGLTFLDHLNLVAVGLAARRREGRRWNVPAAPGAPRVFYGLDRIPARGEPASGGIVKCQDLATLFPNTPSGANLLYLVSSSLPPQAVYMARQAKAAGARLVLNQDGVAYPGWHGPGWKLANAPMRRLLQEADHVFFQSNFCELGARCFLGERQGPSEILYNAVDTNVFVPLPGKTPPGELVLLLSGSHMHFHRVERAVRALAEVLRKKGDTRLIIAGRSLWRRPPAAAQQEAVDLCAKLGVTQRVEFRGPYTQAEAVDLLQRAHILIHTKYNDPCPRLVVEAMACGLAVVYSASGGVPELVGADAGIGIAAPLDWERSHPPDAAHLAEAILTVAERWQDFSRAARERAVARFDVWPWIRRHGEVFESLAR